MTWLELERLAEKEPSLVHVSIWTLADPKEASAELGREAVDGFVERASRLVLAWKQESERVSPATDTVRPDSASID